MYVLVYETGYEQMNVVSGITHATESKANQGGKGVLEAELTTLCRVVREDC